MFLIQIYTLSPIKLAKINECSPNIGIQFGGTYLAESKETTPNKSCIGTPFTKKSSKKDFEGFHIKPRPKAGSAAASSK